MTDTVRLLVKFMAAIYNRLRRWWKYPLLRGYSLRLNLPFWRFRKNAKNIGFHSARQVWATQVSARSWVEQGSVFWVVLREILFRVILAIGLVVTVSFVERLPGVQSWLDELTLSDGAQLALFSTLVQMAGTLLGLYFTAISVVVSTGYARVPSDIRALMIRDEVSSLYFGVLAQFTAVMTVMLAATSFAIRLGALNNLLAASLALFSIFSFVVLSLRALDFFEPANLIPPLNKALHRSIQSVTPKGFNWQDASFQAHHQKVAESALECYANLVTVAAAKENVSVAGLADFARELLRATRRYARAKATIPSDSFWFKRTEKQKHWLTTSEHEVGLALVTDTALTPEQVPDRHWFEARVAEILRRIAQGLVERQDFAGLGELGQALGQTVGALGEQLAVTEALQLWRAPGSLFWQRAAHITPGGSDLATASRNLGLMDLYACGYIGIFLGVSRGLPTWAAPAVIERTERIDWAKRRTLYAYAATPRQLVHDLELLSQRLEFEKRVEGEIISPSWLWSEMAARGLATFLHESVPALLHEFEQIATQAETLLSASHHVAAAQLSLRKLETANKLLRHLHDYRELATAWEALNRSKEYPWPKLDWDGWRQRITTARTRFIRNVACSTVHLESLPDGSALPDLFGQAYSVLGDECVSALMAGDEALFQELFRAFFPATLAMSGKLLQQSTDSTARALALMSAPLLDLLAISGYAEIFSALDSKAFSSVVRASWDAHLAKFPTEAARQPFLRVMLSLAEQTGWLSPRATLRMRWKQALEQVLRQRGLMTGRPSWREDEHPAMQAHADPLIRALAAASNLFTDAEDVFLVRYVLARPEVSTIPRDSRRNWKLDSFANELSRQTQRGAEGGDSDA